MNFGIGCRLGLDPELPWLWPRLAAVAPIGPPTLGTSICQGCDPKKPKKKKKKESGEFSLAGKNQRHPKSEKN